MKKIKYTFAVLLLVCSWQLQAQNCDIPLRVILPQQAEEMPSASQSYLINKLRKIVVDNGIVGGSEYSPFAITAKLDIIEKHILSSAPTKIVQTIDISLYIIDTKEEKVFSSTTIEVKAVGNNETKSYMDGIKQIQPSNPNVQSFIQKGKDKILDYYNRNYSTIIKKAQALAALKQYEEALFYITSVPECSIGYDAATKASFTIYKSYIDQLCIENLALAKMAWAAEQNQLGAEKAGEYLSNIYPESSCYDEAMQLHKEIKSKVLDDWKFEIKQYQDAVSLESQRISSIKAIGVAYGNGQKPTTTNILWLK